MEAVGVGANVLAFVVLGLKCTKMMYTTLDAVKDGPPSLDRLARNVFQLHQLLERLLQSRAAANDDAMANCLRLCADELKPMAASIEALQSRLEQLKAGRLWKRLKIFIKEASLDRIT